MPSAITHFAIGAGIGAFAPSGAAAWRCSVVLGITAAMPDLDVLGLYMGVPYGDALGHRGLPHSLVFAVAVAPAAAWLCSPATRARSKSFGLLCLAAFTACASHGLLDAFTNGGLGVGLLIPFSETRFFWPWRPILVSPLSVGTFVSGAGVRILVSELVWVWLPAAVLFVAARFGLRRSGRAPG